MADLFLVLAFVLFLVVAFVVLAVVVVSPIIALGMAVEARRPLGGRRIMTGGLLLIPVLVLLAFVSLTGVGFRVTPAEAQREFSAVLGFDIPPVARVEDARDLGWAPTDGPHYGYTAVFDSSAFAAFMVGWGSRSDSLSWEHHDSARHITYMFWVDPEGRRVRYFHADE